MKDQLSFSTRTIGDISIIDLDGKVIGSRAFHIKKELTTLLESGTSGVILNFAGVTSIDSLGAMTISSSLEEGIPIKIINISNACLEILEQNQTAKNIPVFGTEDEALGYTVANNPSFKEKRRHERFSANVPVEILINNYKQRGVLLNISEEGALVGYLDPLSPDAHEIKVINIMMKLPFLGSLELEGTPLRFGRNSHMNTIGIQLSSKEKSRSFLAQIDHVATKDTVNKKATYPQKTHSIDHDI